jgi:hypothetical protein
MTRRIDLLHETLACQTVVRLFSRAAYRILWLMPMVVSACMVPGIGRTQEVSIRDFPEAALRGRLEVVQPPDALLDGKPVRLAPGVRIRSTANLLVTSATLVGERRKVNYVRDAAGELQYVWLLTDAEASQPRASGDGGGILSWFGF